MRIFVLIALLLSVGCTSIDIQGNHCDKDGEKECDVYVPLYTPLKFFVISAID